MKDACYIIIQPGAGGDETKRLAKNISKHIWKFCSKYKVDLDDELNARIEGKGCYKHLQKLAGIHKIFTLYGSKRHTCYVSVRLVKEVDQPTIKIDWDKDVRIDTFRSGGKGGQHQNTTDSGARMTYLPLKIATESRTERSQHVNKENCRRKLISLIEDYHTPEAKRFNESIQFGKCDYIYWEKEMKNWFKRL